MGLWAGREHLPAPLIKRLSPTALNWFEKDPDKFVMYYVFGEKREGQTTAMAMGSAFDARIKGKLEADLLGVPNRWLKLFMDQVEPQHHDYTSRRSQDVVEAYVRSGAYAHLLKILEKFQGTPKFEFDAAGILDVNGLKIPIYGKPDAFIELEEFLLVLDWKLNGFMSQASPAAGYVSLRSEDGHNAGGHKNTLTVRKFGLDVALGNSMRDDWQTQLLMYQFMLNPNATKPWIAWIEQLAYKDKKLRVASHRTMIGEAFTLDVVARIYKAWHAIETRHYFAHLSREESDKRLSDLQNMDDLDRWLLAGG